MAYATEYRRRVKEQMNKRKPDDEFARINLSYFKASGEEKIVFCPESKDAAATQQPTRRRLSEVEGKLKKGTDIATIAPVPAKPDSGPSNIPEAAANVIPEPKEQHFTILYGDVGYSYESIMAPYLHGAKAVIVEDPYIRLQHQIHNFVRFCETVLKSGTTKKISLITGYDDKTQLAETTGKLEELKQSLLEMDVALRANDGETSESRKFSLTWA